jgi:hypothetical protein
LILKGFFFAAVTELLLDCWEELECVRVRGSEGDPDSAAEAVACVWSRLQDVEVKEEGEVTVKEEGEGRGYGSKILGGK